MPAVRQPVYLFMALIVWAVIHYLIWWFLAELRANAFASANYVITSWFGDAVMVLSLWALWYHTLGGLRHLIWDTGRGLELEAAERMGWVMIIGSLVLTAVTIFCF